MFCSRRYLSIDKKKVGTPTLRPTNLPLKNRRYERGCAETIKDRELGLQIQIP